MSIHAKIDLFTDSFAAITLDQLNSKAAMMSGIDNKYIVKAENLMGMVPQLLETFDILEISDQRAFAYDTRYYDDVDHSTFNEHHQGRRQRIKVRAREYVGAGLCFLEVKVKGLRGMTEKHRIPYDTKNFHALTPEAVQFAQETYSRQYGTQFNFALRPSLDVHYKRMTLVARAGGERMTIDTNLRFKSEDRASEPGTGVFILETKSANGRGLADRILRAGGERPTNSCSKYCIGMAATGQVWRYNRFLPALRGLGLCVPDRRS